MLVRALGAKGITDPFPIQTATLPDALNGKDVCGRAPTGSGKTLAFGLPLLASLAKAPTSALPGRPLALVLVPTRELAAQVAAVLSELAKPLGATVGVAYGGVGYGPQRVALRRGLDLLIGCPGRIEDLIAQGDLDLSDVRWAVLDEADRMADMGFLPSVKRLMDRISPKRQILLFSATLDGAVDVIVRRYLHEPRVHESLPTEEDTGEVTHLWWQTDRDARADLTARLVERRAPAVVFCRTRHGADRLTRRLQAAGVKAAAVHGSRSQPQRDRALAEFSQGRVDALVATDVAARGIHVDGVACVVHFDPPGDAKDYVHRSGRTGRAGADGLVVTLVTAEVAKDVKSLQRTLGHDISTTSPDLNGLAQAPPRVPLTQSTLRTSPAPRSQGSPRRNTSAGRRGVPSPGPAAGRNRSAAPRGRVKRAGG